MVMLIYEIVISSNRGLLGDIPDANYFTEMDKGLTRQPIGGSSCDNP